VKKLKPPMSHRELAELALRGARNREATYKKLVDAPEPSPEKKSQYEKLLKNAKAEVKALTAKLKLLEAQEGAK
jgi:hypothetical protein